MTAEPVALWSETRNEADAGRFGVSVPGFAGHESLSAGDVAVLPGVSGSTDPAGARTNTGILCLAGTACAADVSVRGPDGAELGSARLDAPALSVSQKPLSDLVPAALGREGLSLRVTARSGRLRPYAVRNDNRSSDGVLVPAAVDRTAGSTFVFPVGCRLGRDCWLGNHVDRDPASGAWRDYAGGSLTYDAHEGTDVLVNGFAAQDLGADVLAAAAGQVVDTADGFPDRCTGDCELLKVNYVILAHADGTWTAYFHLRKGSLLVAPGDRVARGQKIAEVGSSGSSTDPHLHLDWYDPATQTFLDPFVTPADGTITPWEEPPAYQGFDGLRVARLAVSRQLVDLASWSLDPPAAASLRRGETVHVYVFVVRPAAGAVYTLEVRDGGGAVVTAPKVTPEASLAYAWLPFPVTLQGAPGDWQLRVLDGDRLVKAQTLAVQ